MQITIDENSEYKKIELETKLGDKSTLIQGKEAKIVYDCEKSIL